MDYRKALVIPSILTVMFLLSAISTADSYRAPDRSGGADRYEIALRSRRFVPVPGRAAEVPSRRWHGLVQFWAPPTPALLRSLRKRAVLVSHAASENTAVTSVPGGFDPALLPEVRWHGPVL